MKSILLFCFLVTLTVQSFAQQNPEYHGNKKDKLLFFNKITKYRKMKNAGAFLTISGGILAVVAIVNLNNSSYEIAYLLGEAALGSGIPLWIIGSHTEKKYTRKLENLSVGFNIDTNRTSLSLTYRF